MYAIIRSGGKQYRVSEGDLVDIERLDGPVGQQVNFDDVLAVSSEDEVKFGDPILSSAKVSGTIADHGKSKKVLVFKFKRRKMYRRKQGHRQLFTRVRIDEIAFDSGTPTKKVVKKKAAVKKAETKKVVKKKAAVKKAATKKVAKKKAATKKVAKKKAAIKKVVKKKAAAKKAATKKVAKKKAVAKKTVRREE